MTTVLQRSLPIDIVSSDVSHIVRGESSIGPESPVSNSPPSRITSASSLHESLSSCSLDTRSPSPSPPTSDLRKHLSTAKPGRSCLSSQARSRRRKSVTFAIDSQNSSSDDLMTDYNIEAVLNPILIENEKQEEDKFLISTTVSRVSLDKEQKHMEALSLKQYHAQMGVLPNDEVLQSQITKNSKFCDSPTATSAMDSIPGKVSSNIVQSVNHTPIKATPPSTGISIVSPLSGLKLLGSQLDHSNCVLQSFMKRAAVPDHSGSQVQSSSGWFLSTSLVVTAPLVFGLVMESLLG
jgi:hypothetical protein